jgi:hypothetical protein
MIHLSLLQTVPTFLVAIALFILILFSFLLGHRLRNRAIKRNPELTKIDFSAFSGAFLALLGLLLAFTFSMSNSRFDNRRELIIEESNDIGTVVLRTDIYPDSVRQLLRTHLKEYVEQRIIVYEVGMNMNQATIHYLKADSVGKAIWSTVANYAGVDATTTRTAEMIPALNAMIDITTTRRAAGEATIPDAIMYFLFLLCIASAFLLGYDKPNKIDWVVVIGFGVMLSLTVYAIIDLDRPRGGLINMDTPHQKMVELRDLFK